MTQTSPKILFKCDYRTSIDLPNAKVDNGPVSRAQDLASELLSALKAELRSATEEVKRLRDQIERVEPLVSVPTSKPDERISTAEAELASRVAVLIRAKNTADLVVAFLRDSPGSTVPELHTKMVEAGIPIGRRAYLYTVIKKLAKQGLVRRDPNSGLREGKYYALVPDANLVLHPRREGVTQ